MSNNSEQEKKLRLTFFKKDKTVCPACNESFFQEDLMTGRGRLIAGDLTGELRRLYIPTEKYGSVYPLLYSIITCPKCFFSSLNSDFNLVSLNALALIRKQAKQRADIKYHLFPKLDFYQEKKLEHGIMGYLFAVSCYSFFENKYTPSLKRGLCALRCAWLLEDLFEKHKNIDFLSMQKIFYSKATFFYTQTVNHIQSGEEIVDEEQHCGPDSDKNFGYDGIFYVAGYLQFKEVQESMEKSIQKTTVQNEDKMNWVSQLLLSKRMIGRVFGLGESSKNKPRDLLNLIRELYRNLEQKIKELE